jgi:hypothetical protein
MVISHPPNIEKTSPLPEGHTNKAQNLVFYNSGKLLEMFKII